MELLNILRPECISAGLEIKDKTAALSEIARVAKKCPVFDTVSEQEIVKNLVDREQLGTTGFGKGIAIPHCRMKNISEFVVGLITVSGGVDFNSLDGEPVTIIIFIIGPERDTNEHIRLLSIISRTLKIPGMTEEILAEKTPESVYESFLRYSRDQVKTKGRKEKQLCCIYIQDEDIFEDILEVFAASETSSVAVIDAKNSREYLARMPLFAGFWSDSYFGFNRIITAIIDKSLVNETLRNIENITGSLDKRNDILVTVQNLFYSTGSLEA